MKSLKILQTIAKIAHIVCIVLVVMYGLLGACALIGFGLTFLLKSDLKISEFLLEKFMQYDGELILSELRVLMIGYAVVAVAEMVSLLLLKRYLKHELAAGTPFTFDGAKEMLWLGIKALSIFAAAMAVCCILRLIVFGNTDLAGFDTEQLMLGKHGVELILLSVIFRYGAEERENRHHEKE